MSDLQAAALSYADNFQQQDGDSMSREERHAWVAALEYAKSKGIENNAKRVDFAVFCQKRTDLDAAWNQWRKHG